MTYTGQVNNGVVVFKGPRPPDGTVVRVEEIPAAAESPSWAETLKDLIGSIEGPEDLAENHDHYIHGAPRR